MEYLAVSSVKNHLYSNHQVYGATVVEEEIK